MEKQVFNPAQLHLLRMMSYVNSDDDLRDLQDAITSYFAKKVDEEFDHLWDDGTITPSTIDQWGEEHMRTAYK